MYNTVQNNIVTSPFHLHKRNKNIDYIIYLLCEQNITEKTD